MTSVTRGIQSSFLRLAVGNPFTWYEKHGLEPWDGECHSCGAILRVDQPFACGEWRGIVAAPCVCGNDQVPFAIANMFTTDENTKEPKR